jgi:putative PIN family toxin of toxin-antitoxin system
LLKPARTAARGVIDANIWVSGVLSRTSAPARLVAHFLNGRFTLITSEPLLEELVDVLARPHIALRSRLSRSEIRDLIQAMRDLGEIVEIASSVAICRDPDDDAVIETAIAGHADVLVSGDRDLIADPAVRDLLAGEAVRLLTVAEFVAELEEAKD